MAESFAKRRWGEFEALAFELTRDCFGVTPTSVFRTQESKDGGFDGVTVHELGRLGDAVLSFETLMEAKLRSGRATVGLRAFAATMIIAFNGRTHCLVIVTNREFSPQALEAARDFQWKSRIQVLLASQRTVSAWVRPRRSDLARRYSRELLDDIVLSDPEDEQYQDVEIPSNASPYAEPVARIGFGQHADGALASGEIVFVAPAVPATAAAPVIGRARRATVDALAATLAGPAGCAVVTGAPGVGKTQVVQAAVSEISDRRRCLGAIDLAHVATVRQLFLGLLGHLFGIEIAEAARHFTATDATDVFATVGGAPVPPDVREAVLGVLARDATAAPGHPDVDQIHLAEYLSLAATTPRLGGRLLVMHNLDKTTDEVLDFVRAVVPRLLARDISVLLELAVGEDLLTRPHWTVYVTLFEREATLGRFTVPELTPTEAVEFVLERLPGFGRDRAHFITERVGRRPLFLHHAVLWLERHHVVAERAPGTHLIEDPQIFFEGLRPEVCVAVLDRHIDVWRREIDLPYADALLAATLLNGRLPRGALRLLLAPEMRPESMLDALVATGLFVAESRLEGVRVSHGLLLERMIAIEAGVVPGYGARLFDRGRVASTLLEGLESYTQSDIDRGLHRATLLAACERWPEAWSASRDVAAVLEREHQLGMAADMLQLGLRSAEAMVAEHDPRGPSCRVAALMDFLRVEDSRYRLGLPDNRDRLVRLLGAVDTLSGEQEAGDLASIRLRAQYVSWRATFTRESFAEALDIARLLFTSACRIPGIDADLGGRAVAALGITLKAVEQVGESLRVFEDGVRRFPESAFCRREQWSNLAALALRDDPDTALSYYQRIIAEADGELPLREWLHVEVDIAMALFLAERLADAANQATRAIALADTTGVPAEAARGRNILGCVSWRDGGVQTAMALLDRAALDAERSYMERFLWRFRVNLASVASEAGQTSVALANARWAEDRLVQARAAHWADLAAIPTYVRSRWYVALLAIGVVYQRCGATDDVTRLVDSTRGLPGFSEHLEQVVQGRFPAAVFEATTHRQGPRIMITG